MCRNIEGVVLTSVVRTNEVRLYAQKLPGHGRGSPSSFSQLSNFTLAHDKLPSSS
jgi:hypothetical protein